MLIHSDWFDWSANFLYTSRPSTSCTKDKECCGELLCVWGQCTQNATKGEAGSTCQYQTDCNTDLCCAFHKALLFPVCTAKPIERERCFGAPNHLMDMLSWNAQDEKPRKHCPCAGNLHLPLPCIPTLQPSESTQGLVSCLRKLWHAFSIKASLAVVPKPQLPQIDKIYIYFNVSENQGFWGCRYKHADKIEETRYFKKSCGDTLVTWFFAFYYN
uniref:Dickkopf WNT signaling pathway inhibitor 3a n=1 Tax=Echeneis naucrates TaxID=173247 RepID=A0A665V1H3_ECHNA